MKRFHPLVCLVVMGIPLGAVSPALADWTAGQVVIRSQNRGTASGVTSYIIAGATINLALGSTATKPTNGYGAASSLKDASATFRRWFAWSGGGTPTVLQVAATGSVSGNAPCGSNTYGAANGTMSTVNGTHGWTCSGATDPASSIYSYDAVVSSFAVSFAEVEADGVNASQDVKILGSVSSNAWGQPGVTQSSSASASCGLSVF